MSTVENICIHCCQPIKKWQRVKTESGLTGTVSETWQESEELKFLQRNGSRGYENLDKLLVEYDPGQKCSGHGWNYSMIHIDCKPRPRNRPSESSRLPGLHRSGPLKTGLPGLHRSDSSNHLWKIFGMTGPE